MCNFPPSASPIAAESRISLLLDVDAAEYLDR